MVRKFMALFFLVVSAVYFYTALKELSFGTLRAPKAGFLPAIVGCGAVVLSAINFIRTLRTREGDDTPETALRKVAWFVLGLVVYLILIGLIGFWVSTFIAMIYLLKVSDTKGWTVPLLVSAGVSAGLYFVFGYLLQVSFP